MNIISDSAKLYRNVRILNSTIGHNCLVGDDVYLNNVVMHDHAELAPRCNMMNVNIGFGSYAGMNCTFRDVNIGKCCNISWNVSIVGHDYHDFARLSSYSDYWLNRIFKAQNLEKEVLGKTTIENDVYMGCSAVILDGLTIGDGCVIGANTVVTKDLEPYSVAAGNPAKVLRKRFQDKHIERLLNLKWWDLPYDIIWQNVNLLRTEVTDSLLDKLEGIKLEYLKGNSINS
jgi:acetyltransferase-like isoleucine patch superfamily enzyme